MTLRLIDPRETPLSELSYLNAAGRGRVERVRLPLTTLRVEALPPGVEAILVASDLQGRALPDGAELLGLALARHCLELSSCGVLPDPERVGVILAGDLYAELGKRGGLGDVRGVWEAFAPFRWVTGVAGNHDAFSEDPRDRAGIGRFRRRGHRVLDGDQVQLDGLVLGGVSGIVGNPRKPNRRSLDAFAEELELASLDAHALVLHEGPEVDGRTGNPDLTALVRAHAPPLVICGHRHWPSPLAELPCGRQVLNVDARAVVLTA
ncbi:MAG: metallophosphoesterase [Planctomycetota bacterium]